MHGGMALAAQRDQVRLGIVAGTAAKLFVVNLKIRHRAARLASPTVAAEHAVAKLVIRFAVQAKARVLLSDSIHEVPSVA
jgi:hypothetical protein